jgi:hypothetical protein
VEGGKVNNAKSSVEYGFDKKDDIPFFGNKTLHIYFNELEATTRSTTPALDLFAGSNGVDERGDDPPRQQMHVLDRRYYSNCDASRSPARPSAVDWKQPSRCYSAGRSFQARCSVGE